MTVLDLFCNYFCDCPSLKLIFHVGLMVEQPAVVFPTPDFHGAIPRRFFMAAFSMSDSQQTTLTIKATDKKGNPATLPAGSITWAVDQVSLIALTPSPDGQSCNAASVGPLGTATISCKVADTTGATLAAGSLDVTITGGAASVIVITPGTPTEQP